MAKARKIKPVRAFWTMKDGRKIRICEMTDAHLYFTIKMLDRAAYSKWHADLASGYQALNILNGEQALISVENALDEMEESGPPHPSDVWPVYDKLCREADRRKISLVGPPPARRLAEIRKDFPKL